MHCCTCCLFISRCFLADICLVCSFLNCLQVFQSNFSNSRTFPSLSLLLLLLLLLLFLFSFSFYSLYIDVQHNTQSSRPACFSETQKSEPSAIPPRRTGSVPGKNRKARKSNNGVEKVRRLIYCIFFFVVMEGVSVA